MNSKTNKSTWTVWVICLLGFLVSCQDTLPKRSTITPGSTTNPVEECDAETEDTIEVDEEGKPVDGSTLTRTPTKTFQLDDKFYVCVTKAATRPENAVFWKSDFCACQDKKAVSYGNCASFCSDKSTGGAQTLYANFTVTEAISLGGLGNVYAWCKTPLEGETSNPDCELQAKDESGNITTLAVNVPANTNSITANISSLSDDKTYIFTLVEKVSKAKSNSIQMIKFSTDTNLATLGPLKNAPVSQYTCVVREFSTDDNTGEIYYDSAYRLHFYFIPRLPPSPIPAGNSNLICHDTQIYGNIDQELFPRLEQLAGVFNLWDTTDPRFYDNNGNGAVDVNEVIIQKTKNFGGTIPTGTSFFQTFKWPGAPQLESDSGNNSTTTQALGYFMSPWIDQTTFLSYCLTATHYNSSNPLYKALRDIIQVDTEGLYIGEKAPETVTDSDGNLTTGFSDYILIRETDLKAVWFYLKNGVPTAPTNTTVANNAVYFYYPINKASPFVRTSTQRIYRVKSAAELNASSSSNNQSTSTNNPSGGNGAYPPHDRKIGCVPKF